MLESYIPKNLTYDEVFDNQGGLREIYTKLNGLFSTYDKEGFTKLAEEADTLFFNGGITFAVYSDDSTATERIFPFDMVPRLIDKKEWDVVEKGIIQRNIAINSFLKDLYGDQKILKQGIIPKELIASSKNFLKEMIGFTPPMGIYNHINGSDVIRHKDGNFYILEDNVRCPSGVSYVVANRQTLKKTFSRLFQDYHTSLVNDYSSQLLDMLRSVAPKGVKDPKCVVLTPGMYNSAYYEHSWLAQSMGIQLVEGRDLFTSSDGVFAKTIFGPQKVDVIYRRVDDPFIDPEVFRKDSMLGVPGLMRAYLNGKVNLVNAPGTGVADDKAIYTYMPEIIKFYLGEEAIIHNVPTYRCELDSDLDFVLKNIHELVVKPVDESGGYGVSIGSTLTDKEAEELRQTIKKDRRKYIAQPIMSLSTHPTYIKENGRMEPRHMDLRTFCLLGGADFSYVLPGGLTRVALKEGNLIVNSSQGGGSKDTWVIHS